MGNDVLNGTDPSGLQTAAIQYTADGKVLFVVPEKEISIEIGTAEVKQGWFGSSPKVGSKIRLYESFGGHVIKDTWIDDNPLEHAAMGFVREVNIAERYRTGRPYDHTAWKEFSKSELESAIEVYLRAGGTEALKVQRRQAHERAMKNGSIQAAPGTKEYYEMVHREQREEMKRLYEYSVRTNGKVLGPALWLGAMIFLPSGVNPNPVNLDNVAMATWPAAGRGQVKFDRLAAKYQARNARRIDRFSQVSSTSQLGRLGTRFERAHTDPVPLREGPSNASLSRDPRTAAPNLPGFDGQTTHAVLVSRDGRVLQRFSSGNKNPAYGNYASAGHAEGKAAIWMRESGVTDAVLYHNNPSGTCNWCHPQISTLLPEGATMQVVPPAGTVTPSPRWHVRPDPYVGNSRVPKTTQPGGN